MLKIGHGLPDHVLHLQRMPTQLRHQCPCHLAQKHELSVATKVGLVVRSFVNTPARDMAQNNFEKCIFCGEHAGD